MPDGDALLRAIIETPDDVALRLVYADWLEDAGRPERSELVRVCERMRRVPVFCDEYWRLKARRNELRLPCPAEWLAATGYDGSRYDPIWRDGWPDGWRERWRFVREFAERWHGIPMGDVGGRREEARAEEARLALALPPSLREYVAYAHDAGTRSDGGLVIHHNHYGLEHIEGQDALAVMTVAEGNVRWGIRGEDMGRDDPLVNLYLWPDGDHTRHVLFEGDEDEGEFTPVRLTDFLIDHVRDSHRTGEVFTAAVDAPDTLRSQLESTLHVRLPDRHGERWEGAGILVWLPPALEDVQDIWVRIHRCMPWAALPLFLRELASPNFEISRANNGFPS